VSEDGDEVELELAPGLLPADIEGLADEFGAPLSRELRTLLERTAAIDGVSRGLVTVIEVPSTQFV
jgi:hypothetical protein